MQVPRPHESFRMRRGCCPDLSARREYPRRVRERRQHHGSLGGVCGPSGCTMLAIGRSGAPPGRASGPPSAPAYPSSFGNPKLWHASPLATRHRGLQTLEVAPGAPRRPPMARPSAARLDVPRTGRNITACRAGRLGSHGQRTGAEQHGHGDESAEHCGGSERRVCRGRLLADPAARAGRPARAKLTTTHRETSPSSHRKHHVEPPLQQKAGVEPAGARPRWQGKHGARAPRPGWTARQHATNRLGEAHDSPLGPALSRAVSLPQAGLATGPCAWQLRQNRLGGGLGCDDAKGAHHSWHAAP